MRRTTVALLTLALVAVPATAFGQEDVSDETVGIGGRVEVPGADYALTLPDDWVYVRPTPGDVAVILDEVAAVAPGLAPTIEAALTGGLGFSLLTYGDPAEGFAETCNILDRSADGRSLDLVAADEVAKLGGLGELIASGPYLTFIEIPFGRVARIDVDIELPDVRVESSSFILIDADWIHTMTCTNDVRPTDAWGSIVGTFEPLPPMD